MDYTKEIEKLLAESEKLKRAITALETLRARNARVWRLGRQSMCVAERAVISERGKRYWGSRHRN
jgi:hypothetical protein